ncbi:MAG: tetratricopeptide repeat protein [Bacteroidales bacterium]|nr:tetratricopeptide repeat protein [Bacteroidales bacterium]
MKYLASLIVATLALSVWGQTPALEGYTADSLIARGNSYYMQHQYNKAAEYYERVVDMGLESAGLYYNLGNAFYKQKRMAEAILFYEKALLLHPGDDDTRQNLALANSQILDKIDAVPVFFLKRWLNAFRDIMTPDQWAVTGLVLFIISMAGFLMYVVGRNIAIQKGGFAVGIVLLLISLLSVAMTLGRMQNIRKHDHAIIMDTSVNAHSSPDKQSTSVFILHEGTKVMVVDSVQRWKEIRLANGNQGWVPATVLRHI